ncbi:Asp23/Gls24 family envelope stress response protein [Nonomuraea pusilla]|uniref:Asp23/Gls24 family envelope stress response protein n=1 Tax=Nonomuraea pusilla TaxID=46177 RepID=UPI003326BF70
MTAVAPEHRGGGGPVPRQRRPPPPAPESRGRTEVGDRAATVIALAAAREVPGVRQVHEGGLPWTRASRVTVRGARAEIELSVTVGYPAPLRDVARRLREHVTRRVAEQAGLRVTRLDIGLDVSLDTALADRATDRATGRAIGGAADQDATRPAGQHAGRGVEGGRP